VNATRHILDVLAGISLAVGAYLIITHVLDWSERKLLDAWLAAAARRRRRRQARHDRAVFAEITRGMVPRSRDGSNR
jgi:hypothetical protein